MQGINEQIIDKQYITLYNDINSRWMGGIMLLTDSIKNDPDVIRVTPICPPEPFCEQVQLFSIRYRSDIYEVEGYYAVPKSFYEPLPALVFNRGGNREFGSLRPIVLCRYASKGYAAFGSQYRGNCGGTGKEEFGGRDVEDVIKLVDIALRQSFVRGSKLYMVGHSRGGMMTYRACSMDSRIRAAAIGAGLADCFIMYHRYHDGEYDMREDCDQLIGGSPLELYEEYEKRSAVCWAEKIIPPVFIGQGTDDWRVIPGQAYEMDRALTKAGKEHRLVIYPGADHSLKGTGFIDDVLSWFAAHPL